MTIEQRQDLTEPRVPATPGDSDVTDPTPVTFRAAMGSFLSGVAVMTTEAHGVPHGMTANAVSSVSLTPPLVLVCVDRTAHMAASVASAEVFALSFLAEDQAGLSNHFADRRRGEGEEEFVGIDWSVAATGARVLADAVGFVDCEVDTIAEAGDHLIVIGEVVALGARDDLAPLAYFRGGYGGYQPAVALDSA